ncbi:MAG: hypothetical protein HFE65_05575 [Clostridiales bacterium]|nr:hypothetical protein [Clostridiales bacterium]
MDRLKDTPAPIKRKLLLTAVLGFSCLLIGSAMFVFAKDRIMLLLSAAVCILCIAKAYSVFRLAIKKEYETVEGTCVGITPKPLRKYRKIRIMDDEGNESSLLLDKHSKIKIGFRYRFFFKKTQRLTFGSEYFDSAMSSDCFLGYEELGELKTEE